MKRLIIASTVFVLALGFNACEKYVIPPSEDEYISFSASIQPILQSDCVSCHESRDPVLTENEAHTALQSYINKANPESSSLMETLNGSHNSRTTTNNKQIFLDWIIAGAPND